jgi:hypothetical protein
LLPSVTDPKSQQLLTESPMKRVTKWLGLGLAGLLGIIVIVKSHK